MVSVGKYTNMDPMGIDKGTFMKPSMKSTKYRVPVTGGFTSVWAGPKGSQNNISPSRFKHPRNVAWQIFGSPLYPFALIAPWDLVRF